MEQTSRTQLFSRFDQICNYVINEAKATKTRKDPKCWKGKKIGKPATKVKKGVRVNNCVPVEENTRRSPGRREFTDPEEFKELKQRLLESGMNIYHTTADQNIIKVIRQLSNALMINKSIDESDRKIIQTYLDGDYEEDLENYIDEYEMGLMNENNLNQPAGDEHNPGEPSNVDTGAMYQAMDRSQDLEHIASKYQDMTDAQLQSHAEVIDALIEAGEEYRTRYFDGEVGAPF